MALLDVTKTYLDGVTPAAEDLDRLFNSIEDFVTYTKVSSDNFQTGIFSATHFDDDAITTNALQANSVTAAELADHASTDASRAVTSDHIKNNAITAAKINTSAVTAVKRDERSVTDLPTTEGDIGTSVSASTQSSSISAETTIASCQLYSTGRPVLVSLLAEVSSNTTVWLITENTVPVTWYVTFYRDSTVIGKHSISAAAFETQDYKFPSGAFLAVDTAPTSGTTYTYSAKVSFSSGTHSTVATGFDLVAMEI